MPTYDYRCSACGHEFERYQGIADGKLRTCPRCKKPKLVRLVGSGAGLIFKGSGFYETDYKRSRSPAPPDGAAAGEKSAEKPAASAEPAKATEPAKPTEAKPKKTSKKAP